MHSILTPEEAAQTSNSVHADGKRIGIAGGCFDILHIGHIEFLRKAKEQADLLFVLLESDEYIKKAKGNERPINPQTIRAEILSSLRFVDFVVLIPRIWTNQDYDAIIQRLKPALIATTEGDAFLEHKERQARLTGARVLTVTPRIPYHSTSKIAQLLSEEL